MYLLLFIEILVGDCGLCPSDVLSALFLDHPTDETVRTIVSFFYGNGVPLRIAGHLSTLCNPFWNGQSGERMKALYLLWHAGVDVRHRTKYYSTRYRQMYWIHGSGDCTRNEPVTPKEEINIEELGWQGTSDGARILDRLNEFSHEEITFDLVDG